MTHCLRIKGKQDEVMQELLFGCCMWVVCICGYVVLLGVQCTRVLAACMLQEMLEKILRFHGFKFRQCIFIALD